MIPRPIALFIDACKDFGLDLDPMLVHQDPGGFLFALLKGMPFIVELLEDNFSEKFESLKIGDVIDDLDA